MRRVLPSFLVDAGFVLLFALIGRASHVEGVTVLGVLDTAWPFLVGLVLGWAAAWLVRRDWPVEVVHATPIWLLTVAAGLALRVVSGGGGAPLSFALVAAVVLGAFLLGWRALVATLRFATDGLRTWAERQARQRTRR
ncbi:DUF3054 domain-containing protein [Nostocoides sp. HKS02]|uniref:DUF3054 domain-containing protein n=1 Tax=Nostocoides sp. HKS02 TaxID=1813880 RepID=UPI0012B47179|nr:DUF3054 domain-containing protein [Tetrasphaera sp. HKS02]QGN57278.1 DUF3054 family protein [Tetrasphaera sp. HKS02]